MRQLRLFALIVLSSILTPLLGAQTLTGTLFYDGQIANGTFDEPVVDGEGRLLVVAVDRSTTCGFNFCGMTLHSILPTGKQGWETGSGFPTATPYISTDSLATRRLVVGPGDTVYLEGAQNGLLSYDSFGSLRAGWPQSFDSFGTKFKAPAILDSSTGTVFVKIGADQSSSTFPSSVVAVAADGSQQWHEDFADDPASGYALVQGPGRNLYTYIAQRSSMNLFTGLNLADGTQSCQTAYNAFYGAPVGGLNGVFTSFGTDVTSFDAACNPTKVYTTSLGEIQVMSVDGNTVFAVDYPTNPFDVTQVRLLAITNDGTFLWRNASITVAAASNPIHAVRNGVVFVLGQDNGDGNKAKLFLLDENSGQIISSIETASFCSSCGVAVAPNGTTYLNDLGSTKVYKIDGVPTPQIDIFPAQLTFLPIPENTTSVPGDVTVRNPGKVVLTIKSITTQRPFAIVGPVPPSIAPGGQATFQVNFTPTGPGPYSGNITIVSDAPTSEAAIPMEGRVAVGTINVQTNLAAATFSIDSSDSHVSGSGMSATFGSMPSGTYTVRFGSVAGYAIPAPQTQALASGSTILFKANYVPSRSTKIDSVGGSTNLPFYKNAQWQGQPRVGQPGGPKNSGLYFNFYIIDSCQAGGPCRDKFQREIRNDFQWEIKGTGFCPPAPAGCGGKKGTITFSDPMINIVTGAAIKSWTASSIKFVPSFVPSISFRYTANPQVNFTVTTPDGLAVSSKRPIGVMGMIASRGYGQCTWYVAKERLSNSLPGLQNLPLPNKAYEKTGSIAIHSDYIPHQWDVIDFSDLHTAIITSPVTEDPKTSTYRFTIGEMNFNWKETDRQDQRSLVVQVSGGVRTIKGLGNLSNTKMMPTAYFRFP